MPHLRQSASFAPTTSECIGQVWRYQHRLAPRAARKGPLRRPVFGIPGRSVAATPCRLLSGPHRRRYARPRCRAARPSRRSCSRWPWLIPFYPPARADGKPPRPRPDPRYESGSDRPPRCWSEDESIICQRVAQGLHFRGRWRCAFTRTLGPRSLQLTPARPERTHAAIFFYRPCPKELARSDRSGKLLRRRKGDAFPAIRPAS